MIALPLKTLRHASVPLMLAVLAACSGSPTGTLDFDPDLPKPGDYPVHGVDVSKFQGAIDWNRVASSGVKFAYIKATEGGDHLDEQFQANWDGSAAVGLPHGAYHFVYWCRPWNEEIAWFEQNVPVDKTALPPVLDVEATPTSHTCKRHLDRESAIPEMRAMLQEMERHYGKKPIIYTTVDFYEGILSGGELTEYPIWVRSVKHNPAVKYAGRDWFFWQYQSDGYVDGISGKVDRNAFSGTRSDWQAFVGTHDGARPDPAPALPQVANETTATVTAELQPIPPQ